MSQDPFTLSLVPLQNSIDLINGTNPRNTISPVMGGYPTVSSQNIGDFSSEILSSPAFAPAVIGLITALI